MHKLHKFISSE